MAPVAGPASPGPPRPDSGTDTDNSMAATTSEWLGLGRTDLRGPFPAPAVPSAFSCGAASCGGGAASAQGPLYSDIASFRDLVELHKGRHSSVWSAVCRRTNRTVVIKGYSRERLKPRQLANVQREISLLRFFKDSGCKGVVVLLATFEDAATIYMVFEACMRGDLYQLLMKNNGVLHEEFVCTKVVFPLLCVLQQLHELHVVHRDIKPENIFITEEGDIALGDFGLAAHKFQDRMTERVGTLDYMAPEVLSIPSSPAPSAGEDLSGPPTVDALMADAARTYDEKVDIWATGVLVYELLSGRPPFEVEDAKETARLIMAGDVGKFPVHVSQHARDFVLRSLSRDPAQRPTAGELLQHPWLKHYFGGKVPDPSTCAGVTAGLLKSWLLTTWSSAVQPPSNTLKPSSLAPNRMLLSPVGSPRKALSTGDDPAENLELLQPGEALGHASAPQHYKRKSLTCDGDAGSGSPRELRKFDTLPHASTSDAVADLDRQLSASNVGGSGGGLNRLASSQFPSRDSSAGSADNLLLDRGYGRHDSAASNSSGISIASFASLQNVPGRGEVGAGEQEDMGMVQRSVSVCPASLARPSAFPAASSGPPLKPAWQQAGGQAAASGAGVVTSPSVCAKKMPGKSRFAA